MADTKISQLTPITGANIQDDDQFVVARAVGELNFSMTRAEMFQDVPDLSGDTVQVTNIQAKDGTASATVADSTGVMAISTVDINGGTIDGVTIGATTPPTVTNLGSVATADINGGTIDGTVIGGSTPAAISGTTGTFSGDLTVDTDTLFVDASTNNVGIGTSSPGGRLDVVRDSGGSAILNLIGTNGDANLRLTASPTSVSYLAIGDTDDLFVGGLAYVHSEDSLRILANNAERMRIDASGNVGIGTSSPTALLHLANDQGGSIGRILFDANVTSGSDNRIDATDVGLEFTAQSNSRGFAFNTGSTPTEKMRIDSSGNVGIGTSSPVFPIDAAAPSNAICINIRGATTNDRGVLRVSNSANTSEHFRLDVLTTGTHLKNSLSTPMQFFTNGSEQMRIDSSGNVGIGTSSPSATLDVNGSLSKNSGSFKIDHPIKPDTHHLVHSFVEGPQADNLYRGRVTLVHGQATVNLDEAGRMTEGTFVALNGNVQCFTTNEAGWTQVRGSVSGNILTIEAQDPACADEVSWLVIGERHDQHMIDTEWTDENGRVITEPEKTLKGAE